MKSRTSIIPFEKIIYSIHLVRKKKIILDSDLAKLYGVETRVLKQAVRRNIERFPDDFLIEITKNEFDSLRSQNVTLKRGKHSKYLPFAFTEQGVAMLSSVLKSPQAIEVNIAIMRAFVKIRETLESNQNISNKLNELEKITNERLSSQEEKIKIIFNTIRELVLEEKPSSKKMGF
ncbi:MAG: ORF6N domain-containing protein [Melioribacteraceae bacterium]|nr:ORF6N domain-containing protein [Melioribacteraceae bacterium]